MEATLKKLLTQKSEILLTTRKCVLSQPSERETMPPHEGGSETGSAVNSKPEAYDIEKEKQGKEKQLLKKKVPSKQPSTKCKRVYSTSSSNLAAISDSEVIDDDALSTDCQDDDLREIENEWDDKEHKADKVAPSVADLIDKRFLKGFSDEKLKMRLDCHIRPVNCDSLVVPTVNTEVWKALPTPARKADLKTDPHACTLQRTSL